MEGGDFIEKQAEEIKKAYAYAYRGRARLWIILSAVMMVLAMTAYFDWFGYSAMSILMASGMLLLFVAAVGLLFCNGKTAEKKLLRELDRFGNREAFLSSIDRELKEKGVIRYTEKGYRLNMFITRTWFIFISVNGTIIRKVRDISSIRTELQHSRSKYVLVVEFFDNSVFVNSCDAVCDDIAEIIEKRTGKRGEVVHEN